MVCHPALPIPWLKHSFFHASKSIEGWVSPWWWVLAEKAALIKVTPCPWIWFICKDWKRWGYKCFVLLLQLCNSAGPSQLWNSLEESPVASVVTASLPTFSVCLILLCLPPQQKWIWKDLPNKLFAWKSPSQSQLSRKLDLKLIPSPINQQKTDKKVYQNDQ